MATKKATAKKAETKKAPEKAPEKKATGRPPKLGEVTELDLGPVLTQSVRKAAAAYNVDTGVIIRAMVKQSAAGLLKVGPIGTRMALRKFM